MMTKKRKPLDEMIKLWRGIEMLHFDEIERPDVGIDCVRHNDRLRAKAQIVVAALKQYQIELEER